MNEEIHCVNNEGKKARNEYENDDSDFLRALYSADMPTLPIPTGDSRFGSFTLSPARFLRSCRNSRFFRYIHTKSFKMTCN